MLASVTRAVNVLPVNANLLSEAPPLLVLIIFVAIGVGIVLLISWVFYDTFIAMVQRSDDNDQATGDPGKDTPSKPSIPGTSDLFSRLLGFTTFAFVFMLAFVLSTF